MKRLPSIRKQEKQLAKIDQVRNLAWGNALNARDQRDARRKATNGK